MAAELSSLNCKDTFFSLPLLLRLEESIGQ